MIDRKKIRKKSSIERKCSRPQSLLFTEFVLFKGKIHPNKIMNLIPSQYCFWCSAFPNICFFREKEKLRYGQLGDEELNSIQTFPEQQH
jgi:hypothetical protein